MLILGIESSCDETAASIVEDGRIIRSSVIASQVPEHRLYGGVVPEIASRRHAENIVEVVGRAFRDADCTMEDVEAVAVTYAPGLIGALLVGVNFAKGLAMASKKPLVPVHHLRGHIASNYLTSPELKPPFLCLVVSGGHSHIVEVSSYTDFKVLGRTRDDAVGEAYDKAARSMGFDYPGGVQIDRIAAKGNPKAYRLPRPKVEGSAYDFSFSGLKTAVINLLHNAKQKGETVPVEDLAASFQDTVTQVLTEHTMLAARDTGYKTIVLAGGVSANSGLRARMKAACEENGYDLYVPKLELCGDNAAMIASQGYYEYISGTVAGVDLNACASLNIEENYQNRQPLAKK